MRKMMALAILLAATASPLVAQTLGDGMIEIPLRVDGGRLLVPVRAPDGTLFEFFLSTGNATTLTESLVARLGDQPGLTLGDTSVPVEGAQTVPDEQLMADGRAFDGILGSSTLNQFDVLVDVPGERLVLKPIGPAVTWEGMTLSEPTRVRVFHGLLMELDVELNGTAYRAMLDLGTTSLVVNEPLGAAEDLGEEGVATFRLGDEAATELPVRVRDLEIFKRWDPNNEGFIIVGAPVALDCAISLSWVHREIRTCVR